MSNARRRVRRVHTPVTVTDLRGALDDGDDWEAYVRVGGPAGRLWPLVKVSVSTHAGHRVIVLDGADLPPHAYEQDGDGS